MAEIGTGITEGLERVLVVMAHPDDVDFSSAGTMASWTAAGIAVSYCLVTDGEAGGNDRELPRSEMARIRREEQTAAAAVVGVTDLHFLGHPDGVVYVTHELRRDISRVIRQVQPQRVLVQNPQRNWIRIYGSHPDHMAAGEAALCAVYPDSRNPFAHPELLAEGLEPWTVPETWIVMGPECNYFVDITDHFEDKVKALSSHVSQDPGGGDPGAIVKMFGTGMAALAGAPEGRLCEAFQVLNTL